MAERLLQVLQVLQVGRCYSYAHTTPLPVFYTRQNSPTGGCRPCPRIAQAEKRAGKGISKCPSALVIPIRQLKMESLDRKEPSSNKNPSIDPSESSIREAARLCSVQPGQDRICDPPVSTTRLPCSVSTEALSSRQGRTQCRC